MSYTDHPAPVEAKLQAQRSKAARPVFIPAQVVSTVAFRAPPTTVELLISPPSRQRQ